MAVSPRAAWISLRLPSFLSLLLVAVPAVGQGVFRLGMVQPLNDSHPLRDVLPVLACEEAGPFVAAWASESATGNFEVVARLFNFDGSPSSAEIPVHDPAEGHQAWPDLARDSAGNFVVVWMDVDAEGANNSGVQVRLFDSAGVGGKVFAANTHTPGDQGYPRVSGNAAGDFVVAWDGYGPGSIFGTWYRRFDSSGTPLGPEAILEAGTFFPVVAMNRSTGTFVAAWERYSSGQYDVRARRFDSSGVPDGPIFDVNSSTTGNQGHPRIAMDDDGDFVILFSGEGQGDTSGNLGQLYAASGAPVGAEFWVNSTIAGDQFDPTAAFDDSGGFVVAWTHTFPDTRRRAYAARFSNAGIRTSLGDFPLTAELDPANTQFSGEICRDGGGSFRAVFDEKALAGTDEQIFSQRLALGLFSDGFESAGTGSWSGAVP